MKKALYLGLAALVFSSVTFTVQAAEEEFYGVIESRPEGTNVGTWVVSGRKLEVTNATELEQKHGPLVVGACVEVEIEGGVVEEIESKKKDKCAQ